MFSCSQEEGTSPINENTSNLPVSATADAQLKFAKLLSQAASSSIEVRNFLKKEALVQFDNDYDIFYPLIKDKKYLATKVLEIYYYHTAKKKTN